VGQGRRKGKLALGPAGAILVVAAMPGWRPDALQDVIAYLIPELPLRSAGAT